MPDSPKAPRHLTARTRRWFDEIVADFDLEPQHLLLLQGAAECWDRAQQARQLLAKDGLTFTDRHGHIRPHPAAQIERDNKSLYARLIRELALDVSEPEEVRPPQIHGNAARRLAD
jgi:phage terminase small subunit